MINVLLVDDTISFHSMIELFLRQSPVQLYNLKSITSAEDLIDKIKEGLSEIDVILLDISLPGINGIMACKDIRSLGITIPIIIITAKLDRSLASVASEAGATDFLLKPFDGASLRSRIQHALTSTPVHS
jgi:DNA-binding response OmpR family regulator